MFRYMSVFLLFAAGLTTLAKERDISKEVDADGRTRLEISHGHGNITVTGWDKDKVSLKGVIKTSGHWDKKFHELDVEITTSGNKVIVQVIKPRANWSGYGSYHINYELMAPRGMSVELTNAHGNTEVHDFQGDASLNSSHGHLKASKFGGDLKVTANHGNATVSKIGGRATARHNHGNIELEDINGDLSYSGNHGKASFTDVNGSIDVRSSHGKIGVDGVLGGVSGTLSHSDLDVTTRDIPDGDFKFKASHGNVTLNFPENTGMNLDVEATHGKIRTDSEARVQRERNKSYLRGKVHNGDVLVQIDATHGNVTINSL